LNRPAWTILLQSARDCPDEYGETAVNLLMVAFMAFATVYAVVTFESYSTREWSSI
jgi:hypothetical protein